MNDLQVFQFEGEKVRIIDQNGEPWWVLKDVCDILGIANSRDTADRLDDDEKNTVALNDGTSGNPYKTIISESGLYNVILRSNKPDAKRFKKWITSEVLPSIRKNGGYLDSSVDFTDPDNIQKILDQWKVDRKKLEESKVKIAEDAPKVEFYDQVADSDDALSMRDVAAILNMPGWGRNNIFGFLREQGVLDKENVPYRPYQDKEYFRVILNKWTDPQGETHIDKTTLVYPKGVDYIRKLFKHSPN